MALHHNQKIEHGAKRRDGSLATLILLIIGLVGAWLAFFGPPILSIIKNGVSP